MPQEDRYEIDGSKDAKEYYWTGAKGERNAYSKAYADARADNNNWNNNKGYMENVGKGGIDYDQARMKDDADWEQVKYDNPKLVIKKRAKSKPIQRKSAKRKKVARKR